MPLSLLSCFSTLLRLGIEMLSIDCEMPLLRIGINGNNNGTLTLLLISYKSFSAREIGLLVSGG